MDWLISPAWAQGASAPNSGDIFIQLFPLILLFIVFYFLLIRPQAKRAKEHKQMIDSLRKGDEIITNGGLLGKITECGESFIQIEVAPNTEVKVQRAMIAQVMPKGTMKTL